MIRVQADGLTFRFEEVHPDASLTLQFQRTLRIPDDGRDYPLPPSLGSFPLRETKDYPKTLPDRWREQEGAMLPMHQSEAMWISFGCGYCAERGASYPFAVQIAAGRINAVTGEEWQEEESQGLGRNPQDYLVAPTQPWLDGFAVEEGVIRQFVAMPLGQGYSAEEQVTGQARFGGVQIRVIPMKREAFQRRFSEVPLMSAGAGSYMEEEDLMFEVDADEALEVGAEPAMGLGLGGRMEQRIYEDPFDPEDWDLQAQQSCFLHLTNSELWRSITGEDPPLLPLSAKDYSHYGFPWFEYYGEGEALGGSKILKGLKSVFQLGKEKGEKPLPENESVEGLVLIDLDDPHAAPTPPETPPDLLGDPSDWPDLSDPDEK